MIRVDRVINHQGMDIVVETNAGAQYFTVMAAKELRDKLDKRILEWYALKHAKETEEPDKP